MGLEVGDRFLFLKNKEGKVCIHEIKDIINRYYIYVEYTVDGRYKGKYVVTKDHFDNNFRKLEKEPEWE